MIDDCLIVSFIDRCIHLSKDVLDAEDVSEQILHEPIFKVLQVLELRQVALPAVLGDLGDIVAIVDGSWQISSALTHRCENSLL